MGDIIGNSFKREIGKNTAKVVSNFVFGDHWSTPYRRVGSGGGNRTVRREVDAGTVRLREMEHEERMERINAAGERSRVARKNQLYELDKAVLENVDKISAIVLPKDEKGLVAILRQLETYVEISKWEDDDSEEGHIRNQYTNALFSKYQSALFALQKLNKNNSELDHFKEIYSAAESRKYPIFGEDVIDWEDPPIYRIASSADRLLWQIDKLGKHIKQRDWKRVWVNGTRAYYWKRHNKWTDGLWKLYKSAYEAILNKKDIPEEKKNVLTEEYKRFTKRRRLHEYLYAYWITSVIVLVAVLIFMLLIDSHTRNIILVSAACIAAITAGIMIYFKVKKKKAIVPVNKIEPVQEIENDEEPVQAIEEPVQQEVAESEDDIFFDLNEEECIDTRLHDIWQRYAKKVAPEIIARKPIFAADGVKDSILFVGINPSSSPDDDKLFLHSDSDNSLLYGSFYQREDAPMYFRALEGFASQCGFAYTQMNLLYVPENNRDLLLKVNSDFIREQLELSYDTIVKINPVAIVFFTDYCKRLIFGAERWVNPATEKNGAYILNGTKIPVFFSEDVTTLNAMQQQELIQKIKSAL